jgi:hypothetical protein
MTIQLGFFPYFSYHFTIQLGFLPYFSYLFTLQLTFLPYFTDLFTIQLTFLLYFPNLFTIQLTFLRFLLTHLHNSLNDIPNIIKFLKFSCDLNLFQRIPIALKYIVFSSYLKRVLGNVFQLSETSINSYDISFMYKLP